MTRRVLLAASLMMAAVAGVPAMGDVALQAPVPVVSVAAGSRTLVIPFLTLNVPTDQQWIGKGVQESLVASLGQSKTYAPVAFQGQTVVEDNATALRMAKDASAAFVVRGSAQVVNGDVRLTAQLLDARTGDTVTTAIATGAMRDLLKLEDEVAGQLRGEAVAAGPALGLKAPAAPVAPAAPMAPLAPAYSAPQPLYAAPPVYTAPEVYPPAPFNDISLSAQDYNAYPVYTYQPYAYSTPIYSSGYCYPSNSSVFIGGGFGRGFQHFSRPIYCAPVHFGGGFGRGGVTIGYGGGFHGSAVGGGFHGGGFSGGGFHGGSAGGGGFHGGGFGGGHGGRR